VDGRVLGSVEAVGKHLLLRFEGGVVVRSHLRMNGRWRVRRLATSGWRGSPWLVLRTSAFEATQWNGPDLRLDDGRASRVGPDLLADDTRPEDVVALLRAGDHHLMTVLANAEQRVKRVENLGGVSDDEQNLGAGGACGFRSEG
jgi:endonuclease-8